MADKSLFLLITILFCCKLTVAQLTKVTLSCETQKPSCGDSTKYCDIVCELPATVKADDLLDINRVIGISTGDITATKSLLSITAERMTENMPQNIGNPAAYFTIFHKFTVTHSKLKFIKQMDFTYMSAITELDLSHNRIEIVPTGVFDSLTQLEILLLHNNNISYLSAGTLNMLTHLKHFYAQYNRIKTIDAMFFGNNTKIERILLQKNEMESLDEQFDQLFDLSMVDLRGNDNFCDCKVLFRDESLRKKRICENETIQVEVEWKDKFKNCSMNEALKLNSTTIGPCALNEVIRMINARLKYENCVWDYLENKQSSNAEADANCTIPRKMEEKDIWAEYEECVHREVELNAVLGQLLEICYSARNSTINEARANFNSCIRCTKMSVPRNVEKCKLRYIKDHGDDIIEFQRKVSSYYGRPLGS